MIADGVIEMLKGAMDTAACSAIPAIRRPMSAR